MQFSGAFGRSATKEFFTIKYSSLDELKGRVLFRINSWMKVSSMSRGISMGDVERNLGLVLSSSSLDRAHTVPVTPKPPTDFVLQFDGSCLSRLNHRGQAGIGGRILISLGTQFWAYSGPIEEAEAVEAEVQALLMGLRCVKSLNISSVVVEGDSKVVISWMLNQQEGPWRFSHQINEIRVIQLQLHCVFRWIPRNLNSIADALAKSGVGRDFWYSNIELPF
uniref:RNase H type-1 domain-containing protein n=1 Tax=Nelumbo nucifera TaxID=4432 RepID=A0A822YPY1_NELNU|nr:TPA_asm: hypothetical protein HUJ06_005280 [Nelumbo nucifera]